MTSLITFTNASVRQRDRIILQDINWNLTPHQHTAILGPNGAGKSTLIQAILGQNPIVKGTIAYNVPNSKPPTSSIGYVSFQLAIDLILREDKKNLARSYAGTLDTDITTTQDLILSSLPAKQRTTHRLSQLYSKFKLLDINTQTPLSHLSTGQFRQALIARALIKDPQLLILDEPYDGLDTENRAKLTQTIAHLVQNKDLTLILVTHRIEEISPIFKHIILLKKGAIIAQGNPHQILTSSNLTNLYDTPLQVHSKNKSYQLHYQLEPSLLTTTPSQPATRLPNPVLSFQNVTVSYPNYSQAIISNLTWTFKPDQNWAILGPNGSGKSTITKLITATHPQTHSNNIQVLGKRVGQGTSIWDIKKHVAIISPEIQLQFRKHISAYDVIASGFFDSIGLYRQLSPQQHQKIQSAIDQLNLNELTSLPFTQLSNGQRRLTLIARALIKPPQLLILDEITHGLDIPTRSKILNIIQSITTQTPTKLILITHHHAEIPPAITHILKLPEQTSHPYQDYINALE